MKKWTLALLLLIIADSIFTIFIGRENNPLTVWAMNFFNMSLPLVMVVRVLYCLPLLWILNRTEFSRLTFLLYIGIYTIFSGVQFV